MLASLAALAAVLATGDESAAAPSTPSPAAAPLRRDVVPVAVALFPGLIVHGSGHFVAGDRKTAYRLLAMEGLGLVTLVGGVVTLVSTGASRQLSAPIFALPVAGAGLFIASALGDLYGVAAPQGGTGAPELVVPSVEARVGARYVYDPTVSYGALLGPALDLRWRGLRLSPSAWLSLSHENVRLSLLAAYRPWGPRPASSRGPVAVDGSYAELVGGVTYHRFGPELFSHTIVEAQAVGRFDMRRMSATMTGSFVDWGVGLAMVTTHYRTGAEETDGRGLLLAHFGYGLYLGRRGEVSLYYDHRHDDYAGGAKLGGIGSGAAGHAGLRASAYASNGWGAQIEAQAGSAYVAGLSILYRLGAP